MTDTAVAEPATLTAPPVRCETPGCETEKYLDGYSYLSTWEKLVDAGWRHDIHGQVRCASCVIHQAPSASCYIASEDLAAWIASLDKPPADGDVLAEATVGDDVPDLEPLPDPQPDDGDPDKWIYEQKAQEAAEAAREARRRWSGGKPLEDDDDPEPDKKATRFMEAFKEDPEGEKDRAQPPADHNDTQVIETAPEVA